MKKVAIITARGGSKRIPRKNIKSFLGKPIIAYSIETAIASNIFDEVMVSTDDLEIAEVAKEYGATIPFMRSSKNADDYSTTVDVLEEVINRYKNEGKYFDYGCCIYPTAPFIKPTTLELAYQKLIQNNYDTVFPVVAFSAPIQRALKINSEDRMELFYPEYLNYRSQDLEPAFHDAGQFYWFKTDEILKQKKLWTANTGVIKISEMEVQDIDSYTDWELAEMKYKILKSKTLF